MERREQLFRCSLAAERGRTHSQAREGFQERVCHADKVSREKCVHYPQTS